MENDANNLDNMRSIQDISNIPISDIPNSNILTANNEAPTEPIPTDLPNTDASNALTEEKAPSSDISPEIPKEEEKGTESEEENVTEPVQEDNKVTEEVKEEPKVNLKKKQQKQLIIIIIAIVIVFAIAFIWKKRNAKQQPVQEEQVTILSKAAGENLVKEFALKIINVFEKQESTFKVTEQENQEEYLIVTNYDNVVKDIYTKKGLKEFESTSFDKKKFVIKDEEGTVKILKEIPEDNRYLNSNIAVSKIDIKENEINATIKLTTYEMKDDILNYYVYTKEIKLIKSEEDWLVDSFDYLNE